MPVKKVLYISTASNISGATLALLEIIDEIRKRGMEAAVVTAERGELEKRLRERGVRIYRARYASWLCREGELDTLTGKAKYSLKKLLESYSEGVVTRALKRERPDIVHINTGMSPVGLKSAHRFGIPVVWHLRELPYICWKRLPYDADYELRCLREADRLIAISDYVEAQFRGKSADNLVRLYDGVDTDAYSDVRRTPILSEPVMKLSLCGGYEEKGHKDAILAAKSLVSRGFETFHLSFWGSFIPQYRSELEKLIHSCGLEKWITFEGQTSEMPKKWGETDIALVCSTGEAFGRVTVEAMAAGALVIGADAGATPELLAENRGLLYRQGDPEDLADKISYAAENADSSAKIAEAGKKYVLSGAFSMKKNIDGLLSIYTAIQGKRNK